jgi:hypothetical protein
MFAIFRELSVAIAAYVSSYILENVIEAIPSCI